MSFSLSLSGRTAADIPVLVRQTPFHPGSLRSSTTAIDQDVRTDRHCTASLNHCHSSPTSQVSCWTRRRRWTTTDCQRSGDCSSTFCSALHCSTASSTSAGFNIDPEGR